MIQNLTSLALGVAFTAAATGATITVNSDLISESNNKTNNQNVAITPHGAWQPNTLSAFWISYTLDPGNPALQTGVNGVQIPNAATPILGPGAASPTAIFFEDFLLPSYQPGATGSVTVWADDTARVWLVRPDTSMIMLTDANPVQDGACAAGAIGCEPREGQTLNFGNSLNGAGAYRLQFDTYQRGRGAFGLLYQGSVDFQPVPEPSTYALLGAGLAIVAARRLRK